MNELWKKSLAFAALMALAIGPFMAVSHARHIESSNFRAAGEAVAAAAQSGDKDALRDAVDALVELVTGPPADVPGEDHEPDDEDEGDEGEEGGE